MIRPKLGLPPLPPRSILPKYVPQQAFGSLKPSPEREYTNRVGIGNTQLADDFIKALGMRKDEVVLDMYGGLGVVTRSALSGGRQSAALEQARQKVKWWKALKNDLPESSMRNTKVAPDDIYPRWIETFDTAEQELAALEKDPAAKAEDEKGANAVGAKFVVVSEINTRVRRLSFGIDPSIQSKPHQHWEWILSQKAQNEQEWLDGVEPCPVDDRIVTTGADPYTWETADYMLSHPRTLKHLPIMRPDAPPGAEQTHRSWTDPEPHITYIAQVPHNYMCESLVQQWLQSAVGAADGHPTWIWRWGRVRLALLVSCWSYDRITARPGEMSRNKNSVMAEAMYHITPLPPYHHVPNVDKGSTAIEARPWQRQQNSEAALRTQKLYEDMPLPRTKFLRDDTFPTIGPQTQLVHPRPPFLGMLLTPRLNSPVTRAQADEWDYVLRHMFVLQAQSVEVALPLLGFNAISLLKDVGREDDVFAGAPSRPTEIIRDLTVEQWARIVDVFANWPFKPEDLEMDKDFGAGETFDPFAD